MARSAARRGASGAFAFVPAARSAAAGIVALALAAALSVAAPARAQDLSEADAVARLFTAERIEPAWLSQRFRDQVPAARVRDLVDRLEREHGDFERVVQTESGLVTRLARADVPTRVALGADGRITGLLFRPAVGRSGLGGSVARLGALPGSVGLLVTSQGETVAAIEPDRRLTVASAAKLAVLAAADEAVRAGRLDWADVRPLRNRHRSLPTGLLQDWPAGAPVTLATAATLMIARSDNTATDLLIDVVGREAVAARLPGPGPFPTTREIFAIGARGMDAATRAWLDGQGARPVFLDDPSALPRDGGHDAIDPDVLRRVGWRLSVRELCALLEETADLPMLSVNPGTADPARWDSVAFKGGELPGVLALATRVRAADGTVHCVAVAWNAEDGVDRAALTTPYAGILAALGAP